MISGLDEVGRAVRNIEECKDELRWEGKIFNETLEIGVMIGSAHGRDHGGPAFAREVIFSASEQTI